MNENALKNLSPEMLELLARRLNRGRSDAADAIARQPRPSGELRFPLSFAQQRLWFLDQYMPATAGYNVAIAIRIEGAFDRAAMRAALDETIRRHEILRTVYAERDGESRQIVLPPREAALVEEDLSAAADTEAEARRRIAIEAKRPFDLTAGPVFRARLLTLGEDHCILALVIHHIAIDGWSASRLMNELLALYAAHAIGEPSPLPEPELQYADFAVWQRQTLTGAALKAKLTYWRDQLTDAPTLDMPLDRPRPAQQSLQGARLKVAAPPGEVARLRALAKEEDASLFMATLAVFVALLQRYTGQEDITVGVPFAGRDRPELESVFGFFINTLPLRARFSADGSFRELLRETRLTALDAQQRQDIPFEKIVDELKPERDPSRTPFYQTGFNFKRFEDDGPMSSDVQPQGARLSLVEADTETSKYDLMMDLEETADRLTGWLEYSPLLFDAGRMSRFLGHFLNMAAAVAAEPDLPLSRLNPFNPEEWRQLSSGHAHAETLHPTSPFADTACAHELFEAQAGRRPQAPALTFHGKTWSYDALNRKANQVAHFLISRGVGPEVRVGLCFQRSFDMVAAILGALKAGGVYVPLDPAYPEDRLRYVAADSDMKLMLAQADLETPPAAELATTLDWSALESQSVTNPGVAMNPANAAYVIYTSGSTGRPKGVAIPHRNIVRLLGVTDRWFGFDENDVWPLFHSYAFDVSVWELWGAFFYGGRLVVPDYWTTRNPQELHDLLAREGVTVLNQTPSAFRQLVALQASLEGKTLPTLRTVIFAGEALNVKALEPWFSRYGAARPSLANLYGITEITVHGTYRLIQPEDMQELMGSPIGVGFDDLDFYLLDRRLDPVPTGVPGEIFVGGPGLARGYLNRPELTAERFLPNPFTDIPGERIYKSGDQARLLADGEMLFHGRLDDQVKVRGFRIELGEIESTLTQHEHISEAYCRVFEKVNQPVRLAAYVKPVSGAAPTGAELRQFLLTRLPDYMIPAFILVLDEIPLTPSGKVNRRALPEPAADRSGVETTYAPPRNFREEILVSVWEEILEIQRVGIHDNYFALGGDSILSIRLRGAALQRGVDFTLQQLFHAPTVAELAAAVGQQQGESALPRLEPFALISAEDRLKAADEYEDVYPVTQVQAGMLYHIQLNPDDIVYHNIYVVKIRAAYNPQAFQEAAQRAVDRHPILRTGFDMTRFGEPMQMVRARATIHVPAQDLGPMSEPERQRVYDEWVAREKRAAFEYADPPLLRLKLFGLDECHFALGLTECHPIFDGWSLHSLVGEIFETYLALIKNPDTPPTPPLTVKPRDFVYLERQTVQAPESQAYWRRTLAHCQPLTLPRFPHARRSEGPRTGSESLNIPPELTRNLRALARRLRVPAKSMFLAAHFKTLSLLIGQGDVITGVVSNGRPEVADGDRVYGLFFNMLPFRVDIAGGSWAELIQRVFQAEQELFPHRRMPLAAIQKTWGRDTLFDVLFNFLHFHVLEKIMSSEEWTFLGYERLWEENHFPLSVSFYTNIVDPDEIQLMIRYDTNLFVREQALAIIGYFQEVFQRMIDHPDERHDATDLLSADERARTLTVWNDTAQAAPGSILPEEIERQALRRPSAPALVFQNQSLSYGELNELANRFGRLLTRHGVGRNAPAAIRLERSMELVVAIIAVWKSGGAYLPVDPALPVDRVSDMLADAGAALILTDAESAADFSARGHTALALEAAREAIEAESAEDLGVVWTAEQLAYVMFTSGSTGRPKGVGVAQAQVRNYLAGMRARLDLEACVSYATLSTFAADLGNTFFFHALGSGGCLHVIPPLLETDAAALANYGDRNPVDCLKIAPSHLNALLQTGVWQILPAKRLVLGGEAPNLSLVAMVRERRPACRVFNHYGPTEATIGVAVDEIEVESDSPVTAIPIGRPMANNRLYIVNRRGQPVPTGSAGELLLAGDNLALGYVGQPDETAARFTPNPFAQQPGDRVYRTGDAARFWMDGRVEFMGRVDRQIKIRGYRVEPGEIETLVCREAGAVKALVAAHQMGVHDQRLAAYVVAAPGVSLDFPALRASLKLRLPAYMVPSAFVALDDIPLLPNGKVDFRALPEPESFLVEERANRVAPRTELETLIAGVWEAALQEKSLSVLDNLFDIGGHSLTILQIHNNLSKTLGRRFPMVKLFERPTIASLAEYLEQTETENAASPGALTVDSTPDHVEEAEARETAPRREAAARRRRLGRQEWDQHDEDDWNP